MFEKLANYIGKNIVHLIDKEDDPHVFRLHRDRVYYVSEVSVLFLFLLIIPMIYSRLTLLPFPIPFADLDEDSSFSSQTQLSLSRNLFWKVQ